jgi:hypothetical protein
MPLDPPENSPAAHPEPELLERLLRGELNPADRRRVVRHLLTGCPRCVEVTHPVWALAGEPAGAPPEEEGRSVLHPASYGGVFERALAAGRRREAALAAEREQASRRCARLLRLPPGTWLAAVHRDRRLQTCALAELLVDESRRAAPRDPEAAVELAELAAAVAGLLDAACYGADVVRAARARAWGYLGDARRLAGDLTGAERALALARSLLGGAVDPAERAEVLSLAASLSSARGRLAEAARLLDRAAALVRGAGDRHRLGRTLIQKAVAVTCREGTPGAARAAADLLREGIAMLDEHLDPRLLAYALHRSAELLVEAERTGEALLLAQRARPLYARLGDPLNLLRLRALEGRIELALERPERAEAALSEARAGLLAAGLGGEASVVTLEIALLHARAGRWEQVAALLAGDLSPLLQGSDMRPGAMFALLVVRRAVETRGATVGMLIETAGYLIRSRRHRLGAGLVWAG